MHERRAVPDGYHSVTPYLSVKGAAEALGFYTRAFGARELRRLTAPGGVVMMAELQIGDSLIQLGEELPQLGLSAPANNGTSSSSLMIYCADVDALFAQAVAAGAKPVLPVHDLFSGDRHGVVVCPFGHRWVIATRVEDVPTEELQRRLEAWLAQQSPR